MLAVLAMACGGSDDGAQAPIPDPVQTQAPAPDPVYLPINVACDPAPAGCTRACAFSLDGEPFAVAGGEVAPLAVMASLHRLSGTATTACGAVVATDPIGPVQFVARVAGTTWAF